MYNVCIQRGCALYSEKESQKAWLDDTEEASNPDTAPMPSINEYWDKKTFQTFLYCFFDPVGSLRSKLSLDQMVIKRVWVLNTVSLHYVAGWLVDQMVIRRFWVESDQMIDWSEGRGPLLGEKQVEPGAIRRGLIALGLGSGTTLHCTNNIILCLCKAIHTVFKCI